MASPWGVYVYVQDKDRTRGAFGNKNRNKERIKVISDGGKKESVKIEIMKWYSGLKHFWAVIFLPAFQILRKNLSGPWFTRWPGQWHTLESAVHLRKSSPPGILQPLCHSVHICVHVLRHMLYISVPIKTCFVVFTVVEEYCLALCGTWVNSWHWRCILFLEKYDNYLLLFVICYLWFFELCQRAYFHHFCFASMLRKKKNRNLWSKHHEFK